METLADALRSLLLELLNVIAGSDVPKRKWIAVRAYEHAENGDYKLAIEDRADGDELFVQNYNIISSLPSVNLVFEAIMGDAALRITLPPVEQGDAEDAHRLYIKIKIVDPFVRNYLRATAMLQFQEGLFRSLFRRLLSTVLTKEYTAAEVTPLVGLKLIAGPLELETGLRLRKALPEELETWLNPHWVLAKPLTNQFVEQFQCVLEIDFKSTPLLSGDANTGARRATAISALRLLTRRNIFGAFTYEPTFNGSIWRMGGMYSVAASMTQQIDLGTKEQGDLVRLWTGLTERSVSGVDTFRMAMRRWESGFDRLFAEDRLIDYWIGLDTLYWQRNVKTEVEKIAVASGYDYAVVESFLDISKQFRNGIVHVNAGLVDRLLRKGHSLNELVDQTGDWLRASILYYLR